MQHDRIFVLGGGYSVKEQSIPLTILPHMGYLIGVNDAAIHAPAHACVSMDRLWMENRPMNMMPCDTWLRRSAYEKSLKSNKVPMPWEKLHLFENDHNSFQMAEEFNTLNGTSSGMCALNRAYHLRPKQVVLLGFDMCRRSPTEPYWYPAYPWADAQGNSNGRLQAWSLQFDHIARQLASRNINVVNVSPFSAINQWSKISWATFVSEVYNGKL